MKLDDLVTIHQPLAARDRHVAIFYLHGGGLLYGERNDLPAPYVRQLTDAGYTLICADYPLAPETDLPHIVDALFETWREAVALPQLAGEYREHFLFGRSAGAFLSLMLAREIEQRVNADISVDSSDACAGTNGPACCALPQPRGILDFYGYHVLTEKTFIESAKAYSALPDVPRAQVDKLMHKDGEVITSGPKPLRYAIYVHARQHEGAWLDLMGLDESDSKHMPEAWSLTDEDIKKLPPLFITASSGDEDVPMRMSKILARKAPRAVMKPVYYLPHDFDRDTSDPTGAEIYSKAIDWMDALCAE